jgi:hypothetical protein
MQYHPESRALGTSDLAGDEIPRPPITIGVLGMTTIGFCEKYIVAVRQLKA